MLAFRALTLRSAEPAYTTLLATAGEESTEFPGLEGHLRGIASNKRHPGNPVGPGQRCSRHLDDPENYAVHFVTVSARLVGAWVRH